MISSINAPEPDEVALVQQVQQLWNQGSQQPATDALRSKAGSGSPWAAALLAWLLMQQGQPGIGESITWAIRAAELGVPGQAFHTFNNAVAQLPADPQLATRLPELLKWTLPTMGGVDLVGQGWNLVAQGQPALGIQLMELPAPWPASEPQLTALVSSAAERKGELDQIALAARQQRSALDDEVVQARTAIEKARDDLETSAKQAGLLVTAASSDATNALYVADAERNAKESRGVWAAGLAVLGAAAFVAILPVVLHYIGVGPTYTAIEQIGLHLASTAALAAFSGVLLARARSRDQAAQRARDLSTAMGTMISYSNQISNPVEKERFMMTMGQMVLQSHLTSGSKKGAKDDSTSDLIALANLIKPSTIAAVSSPSQP